MRPENIMFSDQRRRSLAKMKDLVLTSKPVIKVTLTDEQKDEFVPQYTSLEEITGEVSITASCDTSFEEIYITFEGSASTFVEKVVTTSPTIGRSDAYHNFLRLVQPVDLSVFPSARIIEAGKTYNFPFTFVVPEKLLPQSCKHNMKPGFPIDGHMTLPPSLGDPLVASMGKALMDDMSPHMGSIGMLFWSNQILSGLECAHYGRLGVTTSLDSLLGFLFRTHDSLLCHQEISPSYGFSTCLTI